MQADWIDWTDRNVCALQFWEGKYSTRQFWEGKSHYIQQNLFLISWNFSNELKEQGPNYYDRVIFKHHQSGALSSPFKLLRDSTKSSICEVSHLNLSNNYNAPSSWSLAYIKTDNILHLIPHLSQCYMQFEVKIKLHALHLIHLNHNAPT